MVYMYAAHTEPILLGLLLKSREGVQYVTLHMKSTQWSKWSYEHSDTEDLSRNKTKEKSVKYS